MVISEHSRDLNMKGHGDSAASSGSRRCPPPGTFVALEHASSCTAIARPRRELELFAK